MTLDLKSFTAKVRVTDGVHGTQLQAAGLMTVSVCAFPAGRVNVHDGYDLSALECGGESSEALVIPTEGLCGKGCCWQGGRRHRFGYAAGATTLFRASGAPEAKAVPLAPHSIGRRSRSSLIVGWPPEGYGHESVA